MTYLDLVRQRPCCICGAPAQAHHAKGGSMRTIVTVGKGMLVPDILAIPLCEDHHTGTNGVHSLGVRTWEKKFGDQLTFVVRTVMALFERGKLGVAGAGSKREAPPQRLEKILPREWPAWRTL